MQVSVCFIFTKSLSFLQSDTDAYHPGYHSFFPGENEVDMWAPGAREKRWQLPELL